MRTGDGGPTVFHLRSTRPSTRTRHGQSPLATGPHGYVPTQIPEEGLPEQGYPYMGLSQQMIASSF